MNKPLALIVEDDEQLAAIFAIAMEEAEFETEIAHDGKVAMECLAKITPEAVVLDLNLPYVSGKDILFHIRTEPRFAKTRVMLATADPTMAEELEDKADLVLIKPVGFIQLRELAKRLHALQ